MKRLEVYFTTKTSRVFYIGASYSYSTTDGVLRLTARCGDYTLPLSSIVMIKLCRGEYDPATGKKVLALGSTS